MHFKSVIFLSLSALFLYADNTKQLIADFNVCENKLSPYKRQSLNLLSENDTYASTYTDEYYTAGTSLGYTSKEYDFSCENHKSLMAWSRYLSILWSKTKMTRFNLSFAQELYTPKSRNAIPPSNDHPYAGYLYFNLGVFHRAKTVLEAIDLSVGVVGPWAIGRETQKFIHVLARDPIFYGWNTQLKNEFVLNLNYQIIKKIYLWHYRFISGDILPGINIAFGNADTHFEVGTRLRVGYNLDSDFGPDKINSTFSGKQPYSDKFSFYIFAGFTGRYQARNIFVQGNSFGNPTKLSPEYLIYDGEAGVAIMWRGIRFTYVYNYMSKTFKQQPKYHDFGALELDIAF